MRRVTSKDGTSIAYERLGHGPAVVLVGGALVDPVTGRAGRWENAPLAAELAERFTVVNYDRRGREESGDTLPYAVEREIEDLEALVAETGGSAHVHGVSSGGALALEAAAAGVAFDKISVYEVPYSVDDYAAQAWQEYVEQLDTALAEGRRGDAVALFMLLAGSSEDQVASARGSPMWPGLEAIAHTLAYDAAVLGDGRPPTARLATVMQPTLVATGAAPPDAEGEAPPDAEGGGLPPAFFDQAADAIAASLPRAERVTVEGQTHVTDPKTFAPVLERFFAD